MNLFITVIIFVLGFVLWVVLGFLKYKNRERMDKNEIYSYLSEGDSLFDAIKKAFSNLNEFSDLKLDQSTIEIVSSRIAELQKKMNVDNVVEIYATFIHRYIFDAGRRMKPTSLSDKKILFALESLGLNERNGYFVIKPDKGEDFDKKYPDKL